MADFPLDKTEIRANFVYFYPIQLRWNDHDGYGHLNNARYHALFDSAIMHYLLSDQGLDVMSGAVQPFTVENLCRYHRSVALPDEIECGVRTVKLGTSSARYEFGLFVIGETDAAATGYMVDVYVDAATQRPTPIPAGIRASLERLTVS